MRGLSTKATKRIWYQHGSVILTALGTLGFISTIVMTSKAAPKAANAVRIESAEKGDKLTVLETVNVTAITYLPVVAMATATLACFLSASVISRKRQAQLMSAYGLLGQTFSQYRKAVKAEFGDDADAKIMAELAEARIFSVCSPFGSVTYMPDMSKEGEVVLFYEPYSGRYFNSTFAAVLEATYHANRNLQLRGDLPLNEYLNFLGLSEIEKGDDIQWVADKLYEAGFGWLDFQNTMEHIDSGMECFSIYVDMDPVDTSEMDEDD